MSWDRLGSRGGLEARDSRRGTIGPRRRRRARGAGRARGGGERRPGDCGNRARAAVGEGRRARPESESGRGRRGGRRERLSGSRAARASAAGRQPRPLGWTLGAGNRVGAPGRRRSSPGPPGCGGRRRGRSRCLLVRVTLGRAHLRGKAAASGRPSRLGPLRVVRGGRLALLGLGWFSVVVASQSSLLLACGLVINSFPLR